jgi:hypothetical protein
MGISRKMLAAVGCLATIGSISQVASAQLSNPGFEDICGPASGWVTFGNVSSINFYTTTGVRAIKMYGPFTSDPGYSGIFQDAPAAEGQVWEASCDATNPFWDTFTWNGTTGSQAFVEIQFLDASDVQISAPQQFISTKLGTNTGESPVTLSVSGAVAPAGTAKVRIVMVVEQYGYQGGAVWWDTAMLRQNSGDNVLTNDSFEDQTSGCVGSGYAHWVNFGNGQANMNENVRSGAWAAKLFGGYNGDPAYSGWYQDVPATPGTKWRARGWANSLPTDLIADGNEVFVSIEFKDEFGFDLVGGAGLSQWVPTGANNSLAYEFYQTPDAIAPDYTAFARIVILQVQHGYAAGATWWDDMSFGCPADVDGTGFVDTDDFDAFVNIFEQGDIQADFDGTGFVDTDDFDAFVRAYEEGC